MTSTFKKAITPFLLLFFVFFIAINPLLVRAQTSPVAASVAGQGLDGADFATGASKYATDVWNATLAGVHEKLGEIGQVVSMPLELIILSILKIITQITAFFLWVAAVIFNNFIYYALANNAIRANPFIAVGWQFFRDLANMLFIFIVMYIGIGTMLNLSSVNTRNLLVRVIVVAILINFSLAMARVVIDASNVAALGFYDAFPSGTEEEISRTSQSAVNDLKNTVKYYTYPAGVKNIAAPFMNYSGLAVLKGNDQFAKWAETADTVPLIIAYVATAILHVIAIFIFGAGGILFLIRMITLWVLMILAPIAFISYATPSMESHFKKWWSQLLHQSFFAVAFLGLIYISARMLTSADFFGSLQVGAETGFLGGILTVIIQFAFVAGLLIMSLTVSQSLGAYGASTVVNWGKKNKYRPAGFVGRHTLGRGANGILDSERVKKFAADNPRIASVLLRPVEATAKAKYGGKRNYQEALKADTKRMEELDKYVASDKYGEDIKRTNSEGVTVTNKEVFRQSIGVGKTKEETLENMQSTWLPSRREAIRSLNKRASEENKKKSREGKIDEEIKRLNGDEKAPTEEGKLGKIKVTAQKIEKLTQEIENEKNSGSSGTSFDTFGGVPDMDKVGRLKKEQEMLEEKLEKLKDKLIDLESKKAEGSKLDKIESDLNKKPEKEDGGDKGDKK